MSSAAVAQSPVRDAAHGAADGMFAHTQFSHFHAPPRAPSPALPPPPSTPRGAPHLEDALERLDLSTNAPSTAEHRRSSSEGGLSASPLQSQMLVQVLVRNESDPSCTTACQVFGDETVRELRLRLSKKSWFTSKHCLFLGDRELLDDDKVAHMVHQVHREGSPHHLHIFVRCKDVTYGQFIMERSSLSFSNLSAMGMRERSGPMLCSSSSHPSLPVSSDSPVPPGAPGSQIEVLPCLHRSPSENVIHIKLRKGTQFSWSSTESGDFELALNASTTPSDIKQQVLKPKLRSCPSIVRDLAIYHNGEHLLPDKPLIEYGFRDGDVLEIVPWEPLAGGSRPDAAEAGVPGHVRMACDENTMRVQGSPVAVGDGGGGMDDGGAPELMPMLSSPTHDLYVSWQHAVTGLKAGIMPALAPSGSGGSYFLRGADHSIVAVFKPVDEEPNMCNNPRGFTPVQAHGQEGLRRGIRPGEGAQREVAAYLLDHGHRAGVPATAPVYLSLPDGTTKYGSLQQFVDSDCDCEEMGTSEFSVAEVHKIAVLDLRLANADRNASNILAKRQPGGNWVLTPIDHGYCLPDTWEDMAFEWSSWRQAEQPFSEETVEYIMQLDPEADLILLHSRGVPMRPECARIFKAAHLVLKKVAARRLSPRIAADILERRALKKSHMERMHKLACERAIRQRGGDQARSALHSLGHLASRVTDEEYLDQLGLLLEVYLGELCS